ncbi:MAG: DNA polymerase I [Akkermansiaceae bacterium]|nr:DNA polymerase I [Akkermansiaceae bacterium]
MSETRLFLLDGMALVYRAHFAFIRNPITNSQGVNTSAIYGFTNTLLTIIEKEAPTHLAVAFDTSAPTSRHILYPEYKAQREAMPEELAAAIPEVKKVCAAFKIPVLVIDGFEADDIIGTVARRAEETGEIETFMVTPDKDFAQLVAPHTAMWKPGRQGSDHEVLTHEKILANWGIENPKQVIDILGLWGDASDNIPGVPGIGEKTAKKLVAQYGSVEGLLENTDKLKGKQKENVTNFADQARLSKELATIITDVPIKETFDDFKLEEPDEKALKSLFETWEFRTLTKRLFGETTATEQAKVAPVFESLKTLTDVPHNYHLVQSEKALDSLIKELLAADTFCFDVETSSLDRFSSQLLGIAFSLKPSEAFYLPITEWSTLREKLLPVFKSPALKIGHNLKFDLAIMLSHEIEATGPFFDTMLAHTLVAPDQKHSMDSLSENLLGYSPIKLVDLFSGEQNEEDDLFAAAAKKKATKGELNPSELPIEILAEYAAEDADVTLQLYHKLIPELKELNVLPVMEDIESPLLPVLVAMENEGISMDQSVLDEVGKVLAVKIETLSKEIEESAGRSFNLNSPKQLGEILFGEMKLVEKPKKTKTGQFKTDEQTLASLASKHPIVSNILSYREASKLKSTYVDALPNHRAEHSDRVHTHLHQLVTSTGRLASSDPNLQNIPVRSEMGRELRRAFIPRGLEFTLMAADYSQVELRVMAALSGDPAMIEAFKNDLDIHTATAARVFGVETNEVVPEMRRTAKMVNFGIIYGISAFGLSQRLGIPRGEASEIIKTYFELYPAIHQFMADTTESARENGYTQTLAGRRRYFKDIKSENASIRANAERAAINSPIQGTAADMIKLAMVQIHELMRGRKSRMILQVHDELLFDLHQDEQDELPPLILEAMEAAITLPHEVPIKIDLGFGDNWLQAH